MSPRTESLIKKLVVIATLAGLGSALAFLLVACGSSSSERSASAQPPLWRTIPAAPVKIDGSFTSVWTGHRLIFYGRRNVTALDSRGAPYVVKSVDVAEAYDPSSRTWTRLSPPTGPGYVPGYRSVWTGKQMLVFSAFHSVAYDPKSNDWRTLRKSVGGGIVAWTGQEAMGWGGGCCGDAWGDGLAYDPAKDTYRHFARSPLPPSQGPLGAWTGHRLLLVVSGGDPEDMPYPARLARAAAYDPATDTWKRLAAPPAAVLRYGGRAVWDGHELLVVGNHVLFSYDPTANRWQRLSRPPRGLTPGWAFWTGSRLLVLGGNESLRPFSYDPRADRWTALPAVPVQGSDQTAAWTGRQLIVLSSVEGAAFTPQG
jgi:hypothetical protein